jgi:hypothetical protein
MVKEESMLFENTYYVVQSMKLHSLGANYEVVNKITNLVEAEFKALPLAIEAAMILEAKLAEYGFTVGPYDPSTDEGSMH